MSHEPERNGDQIRIRDMIGNIAVAVGRGAQATANIFGDVNLFRDQEQARTERDRVNMLAMVHNFWIQGVLEKSLYGGVLLQMTWRATDEAVDNEAWQSVMQLPAAVTTASPVTATLTERFFNLNPLQRTLLLLGAPGSGKTTMLLVLARQAIARAEADPTEPIPVVFNLSTWSVKQPALADWLVSEFSDKYYVAKSVSRPWIAQDRLLLLLDGLDEVPTECQAECITAINAFRAEHNIPMVVCCRSEEYAVLPVQLAFAAAVTLEPLTTEQIMAHLAGSDDKGLLALRTLLEQDPALQEFAHSPLVLHTMMEAFHNADPAQLHALTGADAAPRQLFALYVQRMFQRGSPQHPYPPAQTVSWLQWLACRMAQHAQSVFIIERMQPSWLARRQARWSYMLLSRLVLSLIGGLVGGFVIGLGFAFYHNRLGEGIARGFVEGVLSCLLGGIIAGVIDGLRTEPQHGWRAFLRTETYPQLAANILLLTLSVGVAIWLGFGLLLGSIEWLGFPRGFWLEEGRSVGLLVGLCYGLIFGFSLRDGRQPLTDDVPPFEQLNWSSAGATVGAIYGLAGAAVSAVLLVLLLQDRNLQEAPPIVQMFQNWQILWVAIPYLMLLGGIFGGLRGGILPATSAPNQGIRASARNAVLIGVTIGGALALASALLAGLLFQWNLDQVLTLGVYGLFFGVLAALWYGGISVIKHLILRYLLFRAGHLPLRYARFLDYATERIFLRKVGGGYLFVHRLLLEYFAEDDATAGPSGLPGSN